MEIKLMANEFIERILKGNFNDISHIIVTDSISFPPAIRNLPNIKTTYLSDVYLITSKIKHLEGNIEGKLKATNNKSIEIIKCNVKRCAELDKSNVKYIKGKFQEILNVVNTRNLEELDVEVNHSLVAFDSSIKSFNGQVNESCDFSNSEIETITEDSIFNKNLYLMNSKIKTLNNYIGEDLYISNCSNLTNVGEKTKVRGKIMGNFTNIKEFKGTVNGDCEIGSDNTEFSFLGKANYLNILSDIRYFEGEVGSLNISTKGNNLELGEKSKIGLLNLDNCGIEIIRGNIKNSRISDAEKLNLVEKVEGDNFVLIDSNVKSFSAKITGNTILKRLNKLEIIDNANFNDLVLEDSAIERFDAYCKKGYFKNNKDLITINANKIDSIEVENCEALRLKKKKDVKKGYLEL